MAHLRFKALEISGERTMPEVTAPSNQISDYYGENAFGIEKMQQTLSPDVFDRVKYCIDKGKKIDMETADAVAAAVKTWAIAKSVTHYTHWFQPLTGATAEKHDTFFEGNKKIEMWVRAPISFQLQ